MLLQWDPVQLPAEADQRAGNPVDVPDPLQQPAPAAQRPGSSQMPDRLLHQRPQVRLAAVERPLPVAAPIEHRTIPRTAPAEHGLWIRDLPSNSSDDPQQRASAGRRRGMPDGELSAATIEFEDIGEPEDQGPRQA